MATTPTPPRTLFRRYIFLTIAVLAAGVLLVQTQQTLDGLNIFEGPIEEIKIIKARDTRNRAYSIVFFRIKDLDARMGIHENFGDLNFFTNNLKPGDKVKVYFKKSFTEISTDAVDHYVYQLEKDGVAIVDLQESNKETKIAGYVLLVAGLTAIALTYRYYKRNVQGKG